MLQRYAVYLRTLIVGLFVLFALPVQAEPNFPKPESYVTDTANLINPPDRERLEAELKALDTETGWEFWVVTIPTLGDMVVEDYAQAFFDKFKIGKKEKDNGVLLLLARQERKVRIHTGYGAEGPIPDAFAKRIISEKIAPKTKAGDWTGGLVDGSHEVMRLIRAEVAHPGQAAQQTAESEYILGMPPPVFWILLILVVILVIWLLNKIGFWEAMADGGSYGGYSGGGGGSSSGGGGFDFGGGGGGGSGGGGASGDC